MSLPNRKSFLRNTLQHLLQLTHTILHNHVPVAMKQRNQMNEDQKACPLLACKSYIIVSLIEKYYKYNDYYCTNGQIEDLRKSRRLHSISAYRHGLYGPVGVVQSRRTFVGGTVSMWARWRIPVNKGRKGIRNADHALTVRGEHADRIIGSPSW